MSRMNKVVMVFFRDTNLINQFIESGITVQGGDIAVIPLVSNVLPFVSDMRTYYIRTFLFWLNHKGF